jgi:hypothetical protein
VADAGQEIDAQAAQLQKQRAEASANRATAESGLEGVFKEKAAESAPVLQRSEQTAQDIEKLSQQPPPASEAAAMSPPTHKIDPKDFQGFQYMLLGLAMIGGAASKGNWLGVSSTLNGAMKGYIDGDKEKARREFDDFQRKFKAAQAHDEARNKEYEAVRDNKKLSLNAQKEQYRLIAAKYDDQATLQAARINSYDEMLRQIDSRIQSNQNARIRYDEMKEKIGGAVAPQNPDAKATTGGVRAAMADAGISFPPGMRSVKAQDQTIAGLIAAHPDEDATQIVQRVKAGELKFKEQSTELGVVARREGSSAAAINALNREGGLYSQVLETGKKVDMGSAKIANAIRLKAQGQAIADPDISEYVNALTDTRAEFASVLARGGQVTDAVRIASEHAFPDAMSYQELERNVARSKKVAEAIQAGNTSVADAIVNGKDLNQALKESSAASPGTKPFADPDKERRYQEWKASQSGN